ncbi:hypothetical protein SteCoe_21517 [Stentor coeruleus]|uniref:Uncharacterized protein n=1 Tax=Stentor coeruleus TaxID=5963 RepID=A0A1R2BPK9_9CILI|nr:hypothetical protein SteCoe_21517 [Stentor coeruleus]
MNKFFVLGFIALALASTSDVSIDVYFPKSDSGNTEIYAEVYGEDVQVTVDNEDYSGSSYVYEYTTVTVNTEDGSATEDEITVSATTYEDSSYVYESVYAYSPEGDYVSTSVSASGGDGYVSESVSYSDSTGTSADESAYYYEYSSGNETYTYTYAGAAYEDAATNYTSSSYSSVTYEVTNGNETASISYTEVENDGIIYNETDYAYWTGDENTGTGSSASEFDWWVNAQGAFGSFASAGLLEMALVLGGVAVLCILAYRKYTQVKVQRYEYTVRPVEDATGYIRI